MRLVFDEPTWVQLGQSHGTQEMVILTAASSFEQAVTQKLLDLFLVALRPPVSLQQAIPLDLLEMILCDYVGSDLSERFALQGTSKLFRELSNSPEMLQEAKLMGARTTFFRGVEGVRLLPPMVNRGDTSLTVTQHLLPFAQCQNKDAVFAVAWIATFVEDDLETGLALLEHGSSELLDTRATYELGNMLCRHESHLNLGRKFLEKAAAAGHVQSKVSRRHFNGGVSRIRNDAEMEMDIIKNTMLELLLEYKPKPPRSKWTPVTCGYHRCSRQAYPTESGGCKAWLQTKEHSEAWGSIRHQLLACCGNPAFLYEKESIFYLPDRLLCQRCRFRHYCGRACQRLDWKMHKLECLE